VPGSVDEVELVNLAILRGVEHADGMGLNGDEAFALKVRESRACYRISRLAREQ
jgi:hypothetical protein